MKKLPRISDAEWQVMRVIWDKPDITASEVFSTLSDASKWSQKTVNTFLSRLETKGILTSNKIGRLKHYHAEFSESECQQEESEFFLKKVFRGKLGPALLHFAEREELSADDIAKLRQLIDQSESPAAKSKSSEKPS